MENGTLAGILIGGVITIVNGLFAYLVARDKGRFDAEKLHLQWQVDSLKEDGAECERRAKELEGKLAAMQMQVNQIEAKA